MSEKAAAIGLAVLAVVVLLALGWLIVGNDLWMRRTFDPKYEDVRRETFEKSKAYNQGMIQELQNMQFEYEQASPEHKQALASIILHRAADYDKDKMPADLRAFIQKLKRERSSESSREKGEKG